MKHRLPVLTLAALGVAGIAAPVAAQDGAMWRDNYGRAMEFGFLGGGGRPPVPMDMPAADMAGLFNRVCLKTSGALDPVAAAAEAEGFEIKVTGSPVGKNQPESQMLLASKRGAVVSQTTRILEYAYTQCNLTFYSLTLPSEDEVLAAMSGTTGREPDNIGAKVKPNGKPNKSYQPEWQFTDSNGKRYVVNFSVMKANAYMPGNRVLFGLREVVEKKS